MTNRQGHQVYLRRASELEPAVAEKLSLQETQSLSKYLCWMQALIDGRIAPSTPAQTHFVTVAKGEEQPINVFEATYTRYTALLAEYNRRQQEVAERAARAQATLIPWSGGYGPSASAVTGVPSKPPIASGHIASTSPPSAAIDLVPPFSETGSEYLRHLLEREELLTVVSVSCVQECVAESVQFACGMSRELARAEQVREEVAKQLKLHADMLRLWVHTEDAFNRSDKVHFKSMFERHGVPRVYQIEPL